MRQVLTFLYIVLFSSPLLADSCLDVFPARFTAHHAASSSVPINPNLLPTLNSASASYRLTPYDELELNTDNTYSSGAVTIDRKAEVEIDADDGGSVRWYVQGKLAIGPEAKINHDGSPSALIFYVDGPVNISFNAKVNAIIYSTDVVMSLGEIKGAITSTSRIWALPNASGDYRSDYIRNANFDGMCTQSEEETLFLPHAEWRFDEEGWEGLKDEVKDSAGQYHGQAFGSAQTDSEGVVCRMADLSAEGVDDYLRLDSGALDGVTSFTISVWVKMPVSKVSVLLDGGNRFQKDELVFPFYQGRWMEPWLKGKRRYFIDLGYIADNEWHHVVWRRENSTSCLYLDGSLQGCVENLPAGLLHIGPGRLIVGQKQISSGLGFFPDFGYRGLLDELLVFDQSLSEKQIKQIYANQKAGNNFDGTPRVCTGNLRPVAEWRFEESRWTTDVERQIQDQSANGLHGTLRHGGNSQKTAPAIEGNPGSCRYGDFSNDSPFGWGAKGYIEIPDDPVLDLEKSLTITAWIRPDKKGSYETLISKGEGFLGKGKYSLSLNSNRQLSWRWSPSSGFPRTITTSTALSSGSWSHVAVVFKSGNQRLYINGEQQALTNGSNSGTFDGDLVPNHASFIIGADKTMGLLSAFSGSIDEVRVYDQALSTADIQKVMAETHQCEDITVARLEVTAANTASTCTPLNVAITAYDSDDEVLTDYQGELTLNTSSGHGNWSGNQSDPPNGTLNPDPDNDDDGQSTYQFVLADQGSVSLQLSNPHADRLTIAAIDQQESISVSSPAIQFSDNAFVVSSIDSLGRDIVAGRDHAFNVALQKRDSNNGNCGIATEYSGALTIHGWLERSGNDPGSSLSPVLAHSGNGTQISASSSASAVPTTMTFNSGEAQFHWQTRDVGQYTLQLEDRLSGFIEDAQGNPLTISSSSDQWTVRPFGVAVSAAGNPAGQDHNGAVYRRAGEPFDVTVSGVLYQSEDDQDKDGYPDGHSDRNPANNADLTDNATAESYTRVQDISGYLVDPAGGNYPGLSGAATVTPTEPARYTFGEVGVIELQAGVDDYLGSGRPVFGRSGFIGRFKAAHLAVSVEEHGELSNACSGFTYIGQQDGTEGAIRYAPLAEPVLRIEPQSTGGELLKNYTGLYRKLNADDVQLDAPLEDNSTLGADQAAPLQLSAVVSTGSLTETTNDLGDAGPMLYRLNVDDHFSYIKEPNSRIAPFNSDLRIAIRSISEQTELKLPASASGTLPSLKPKPIELRYGRLRLDNVYGPEVPAGDHLKVTMIAEYLTAEGMVVNLTDSCSTYLAQNMTLSHYQHNLDKGEISLSGGGHFSAGQPLAEEQIRLSLPGEGNSGSVTLEYDAPAWLEDDWNDDGHLQDPKAQARFGVRRGHDRVVHWLELH